MDHKGCMEVDSMDCMDYKDCMDLDNSRRELLNQLGKTHKIRFLLQHHENWFDVNIAMLQNAVYLQAKIYQKQSNDNLTTYVTINQRSKLNKDQTLLAM